MCNERYYFGFKNNQKGIFMLSNNTDLTTPNLISNLEKQIEEFKNVISKQAAEIEGLKKISIEPQYQLRLLVKMKSLASLLIRNLNLRLNKNMEELENLKDKKTGIIVATLSYQRELPAINSKITVVLDILFQMLEFDEKNYLTLNSYLDLKSFSDNYDDVNLLKFFRELLKMESDRNPKIIDQVNESERFKRQQHIIKNQMLFEQLAKEKKESELEEQKKMAELQKIKLLHLKSDRPIVEKVINSEKALLSNWSVFGPSHQERYDAAVALGVFIASDNITSQQIYSLLKVHKALAKIEELQPVLKHYI